MYLKNKFPASIHFQQIGDYALHAACYDLEDVMNAIHDVDPYHEMDIQYMDNSVLNFVRTGTEVENLPDYVLKMKYVCAMIKSGHLSSARQLLCRFDSISMYKSILIGIRNGAITNLFDLEPYTARDPRVPSILLNYIVVEPYVGMDLEVVRYLASLTPKDWLPVLMKDALENGEWEYSNVLSEFL